MENYENDSISQENETPESEIQPQESHEMPQEEIPAAPQVTDETPEASQEAHTYRNTGTGRKESPYADSPYEMYHQEQEQPRQEQPREEAPRKPKKEKKHTGLGKRLLAAAAAVVLVVASCGITAGLVNNYWEAQTGDLEERFQAQIQQLQTQIAEQSSSVTGSTVTVSDGNSASQVYADNVDSVVLISSTVVTTQYGQTVTGTSTGSGFILTEDGYVVTNYHVVEDGTSIAVTLYNGSTYSAELVGYDEIDDVAVLKIEAEGLSAVTIGSSDDLAVGDQVVAIGNPLGELTSTLTGGYISGKERSVSTDGSVINMLQTDCAINSGNSGGPLFNMKGEVVGITTAKYSGETSSGASIEGIGFAIPIDDVMDVIEELIDYGYVQTGYLGITVTDLDSDVAAVYGLPVGAYVVSVEEGGGAEAAGIQPGDIIIGLGDTTIESYTDLSRALRDYKPGDTALVTVYRGGQQLELTVTLGEKPAETDDTSTQRGDMPDEGSYEEWYNYFSPFFGNGGNSDSAD